MESLAPGSPAIIPPGSPSPAAGAVPAAGRAAADVQAPPAAGRLARLAGTLPWPLAAAVLGATSIVTGLLWDISWHASIGRDTFWTPAHLAIHLGGLLCGLAGGAVALSTTFGGTAAERAAAVRFWGFRAPLGVWVAIWGTLAMLTSAPFDDWWHNAYGLDVKIISPPHVLLAMGILATQLGAMLQALAAQNRAAAAASAAPAAPASGGAARGETASGPGPALVYAWSAGLLLVVVSTLFLEYSEPNRQHGALFYEIGAAAYPLLLVGAARAARLRWPATTVAALYMVVRLVALWVLPLFPATPMLAPIYNPVRHLWPPFFPELLVFPALAIDLILRYANRASGVAAGALRPGAEPATPATPVHAAAPEAPSSAAAPAAPATPVLGSLLLALALGAAFTAVFLAVHWPFADFMLSPSARNWFFAADQWTYRSHLGPQHHLFWLDGDHLSAGALALCLLLATVSARLGLAWGGWMARVRR